MFCELSSFLQYFEDFFQNIHVYFLMNTFFTFVTPQKKTAMNRTAKIVLHNFPIYTLMLLYVLICQQHSADAN